MATAPGSEVLFLFEVVHLAKKAFFHGVSKT